MDDVIVQFQLINANYDDGEWCETAGLFSSDEAADRWIMQHQLDFPNKFKYHITTIWNVIGGE